MENVGKSLFGIAVWSWIWSGLDFTFGVESTPFQMAWTSTAAFVFLAVLAGAKKDLFP